MVILPVTSADVMNVIKTLKSKNSNVNEISAHIIKCNIEEITYPIALLFNQSISTGKFPSDLKTANITPVHKSGPNSVPNNYRPISTLSPFSKIFELLMKNKLVAYLDSKNILGRCQYGFRSGSSTYDALSMFSSHLYSSLNTKQSVLSIFVDFSKAFDTVNHMILLDKLYFYGIRGPLHSWFQDYLTNRSQCTIYDGHKSSTRNISTGVPQGSVLGPILFLIYINDITNIFTSANTILFADDMTLYFTDSNIETLFPQANQDLNKLYNWCLSNRLTINTNKTFYMFFSNKVNVYLPDLKINNNLISRSTSFKFLGVMFDENFNFKSHINNISNKLSRSTAMLYRLRDFMPCEVLKILYYAHIYPHLLYCNPIWSTTYVTHLTSLNLLHKKIIRIITNSSYLEHTTPLFKNTKILKLQDITKLSIATCMYKHQISASLPTHLYPTRHREQFCLPSHRLTLFRHSTMYQGPLIWNSLPQHIKNAPSLNIFKNKLKLHLLDTY